MRRKRAFHAEAGESVWLCRCSGCGSEMLAPQPSEALLAAQYRDYFARRTELTKSAFPKEAFFRELIAANPSITPGAGPFKALELGSGSGDFVRALNAVRPDASITAVEMNAEGAAKFSSLRCRYVNAPIEEFAANCAERFDVVYLFDVIEHLRDPVAGLSLATRLLLPGGRICMTAPLADSALHRATGRMWPQYKLEHLFYFSARAFRLIASALTLDVVEIRALSKALPASYLLSVGGNFGPRALQALTRRAASIVPKTLGEKRIKLPLGEALVIYEKRG